MKSISRIVLTTNYSEFCAAITNSIGISLMSSALINISLSDGGPDFDYLLGTSRSQHVVVVVVADGGDSCSVSTQGDGRLLDGHVTSLTVRQWPDVETVILRCGDDQFIVFPSETKRVSPKARKGKSLRSKTHFSNCATHLLLRWDVKDNRRLFVYSIQQLGSSSVESGTVECSALVRIRDCIHTPAIIQIKMIV